MAGGDPGADVHVHAEKAGESLAGPVPVAYFPGPDLPGFAPERVAAFYANVPGLFAAGNQAHNEAYQRLLYTIEHPFGLHHLLEIGEHWELAPIPWDEDTASQALRALDGMGYPDVSPLATLPALENLRLPESSVLLHFIHQAYPIYDEPSVLGLAKLGYSISYHAEATPNHYHHYLEGIVGLKAGIAYWQVPECNVFLTRVIQTALWELGRRPVTDPRGL